jgi:ATP-dependent helicase/nuclease subunit A
MAAISKNIPSEAQRIAADPSRSVWVNASAGTGKTKVLTDRVLNLLLSGAAPQHILCLTFTKAAAAEMATRIHSTLTQWATMPDEVLRDTLKNSYNQHVSDEVLHRARQLFTLIVDNPGDLKIQTLHSFCQSVLKRFPLEAGVTPHFTLAEDATIRGLVNEAKQRLLTQHVVNDAKVEVIRDALSHLARETCDDALSKLLSEILNKRAKLEHFFAQEKGVEALIGNTYAALGVEPHETEEDIISSICTLDERQTAALKQVMDVLLASKSKTDSAKGHVLADWLSAPSERQPMVDAYISVFFTQKLVSLATLMTKAPAEAHPEALNTMQEEVRRLERLIERRKSVIIATLSESLLHIAEALIELYTVLKGQRALLDYNDLINRTRSLLTRKNISPWIMFKLDGGIDHILIDEAQDTSPEQWDIIRALCEEFFTGESARNIERTLFVVGDEKQSIFSFQGAAPETFLMVREHFEAQAQMAQKQFEKISLSQSFRSTKAVLNAVDMLFKNEALQRSLTKSTEAIHHEVHRLGHGGKVELWPAVNPTEKKEEEAWMLPLTYTQKQTPAAVLAGIIGEQIAIWLEEGRYLASKGRAINAGDILILVRKRDQLVDLLVKNLKERNIPVAGVDRLKLTEHIAVQDLIALGQFLLLPEDDYTLACVLKTPFIGISEEELFILAHKRNEQSLWQQLKTHAQDNVTFKRAYEYLAALLNKVDFVAPYELYAHILESLGGRKALMSRLGEEITEPVDEFLNLAIAYEQKNTPSLQGFLQFVQAGEAEVKRDMEQKGEEIRIMTVHGSKGLQAPVVILPDTMQRPSPGKQPLLWDKDGLCFYPGSTSNHNHYLKALYGAMQKKEYDEYLRLLYVALTRAEDELYIAGYFNSHKKTPESECWYELIRAMLHTHEDVKEMELPFMAEKNLEGNTTALVIDTPHTIEKSARFEAASHTPKTTLPAFLTQAAIKEESPTTPLSPSKGFIYEEEHHHVGEINHNVIARGNFIHSLLEHLPSIAPEKRQDAAKKLLTHHKQVMDAEGLISEVLDILNHPTFTPLFSENSFAEAPISGVIGTHTVLGQVDRLAITQSHVLVVDYKTGRKTPENAKKTPISYLRQMSLYKALLQKIYPDKQVICALLWTAVPSLHILDNDVLDDTLKAWAS